MNVVKNYCHWDVVYSEHKTVEDGHTVIKKELDYDRTRPTGHELRCLVGASLGLGAKFNINPKWYRRRSSRTGYSFCFGCI